MKPLKMIIDQLTLEDIRQSLKSEKNQSDNYGIITGKKQSAVLLPLIKIDDGWHLLFIKRTETVNHHKGQIAFPGGAFDLEDGNLLQTALREAQEEIGLNPKHVNILGRIKSFHTTSNFTITPYVALIDWPFNIILSQDEVSKVVIYPISWLADPSNWEEKDIQLDDGSSIHAYFYLPYQGEILWGATARIVKNFIDLLSYQSQAHS